jgi:hypothetical protein
VKLVIKLAASEPQFENAVDEVLQRPEYSHLTNSIRDMFERAKEAIKELLLGFLEKTFSNLDNAPAISDRLSTIFMIIGILVFVIIVIIIILRVNRSFDKRRRVREILGEKIDERTTPNSLKQKAKGFIENGDFRQGIRYEFIGLLLLMHEKNLLYLDETKTNEEIYGYLKKNNFRNLQGFEVLINTFNFSWYGHKQLGDENYKAWANSLSEIWNEVIGYEEKN